MLSRKILRSEQDYHIRRTRVLDDYVMDVTRAVSDYMDQILLEYPFNAGMHKKLCNVVFKQLDNVIASRDFQHKAFEELRQGRIDWLAEPFFEGQKLVLSSLMREYDNYRRDPRYDPPPSCKWLFYIDVRCAEDHEQESDDSHKRKREESEWD